MSAASKARAPGSQRVIVPGEIIRRTVAVELASGDRSLAFVASDNSLDRYGDIVESSGWILEPFRANPIFLFQHDYGEPLGTVPELVLDANRLIARVRFADEGISARIDELWKLTKAGVLRAVSVGFTVAPDALEPIVDVDGDWTGGFRFLRPELLELSLVSVPANRNALSIVRELGIDPAKYFRSVPFSASVASPEVPAMTMSSTAAEESPAPAGALRRIGSARSLGELIPNDIGQQIERSGRVAFELQRSIRDIALSRNVLGESVPVGGGVVATTVVQLVAPPTPAPLLVTLLSRVPVGTGASITQNTIDYTPPNQAGNKAAKVGEAAAKPESDLVAVSSVKAFETWAHHVGVTRQALADIPALRQLVDTVLAMGLLKKVDAGVYAALIAAASAFTPVAGSSPIDNAAMAAAVLASLGGSAVTVALNPIDLAQQDIAKASGSGVYLGRPPINGTLVGSPTVPAGKLLAFASEAAYVAEREAVNVVAGLANDDFTKNIVRLLAEWRGITVIQLPSLILSGNAAGA